MILGETRPGSIHCAVYSLGTVKFLDNFLRDQMISHCLQNLEAKVTLGGRP